MTLGTGRLSIQEPLVDVPQLPGKGPFTHPALREMTPSDSPLPCEPHWGPHLGFGATGRNSVGCCPHVPDPSLCFLLIASLTLSLDLDPGGPLTPVC